MTAEPWPGLWLELGGTWRPLAFTTRACPTAHHALHAFTHGLDVIGPLQVPTSGQLLTWGPDTHRVGPDLLRPDLALTDTASRLDVQVSYDGPVTLPAHLTPRAAQDFTLIGGQLVTCSRPDLAGGAHLSVATTFALTCPRAVTDPGIVRDLLARHLRQSWWAAWNLRTEGTFQVAVP